MYDKKNYTHKLIEPIIYDDLIMIIIDISIVEIDMAPMVFINCLTHCVGHTTKHQLRIERRGSDYFNDCVCISCVHSIMYTS